MLKTVWGVVKGGKIELVEKVTLPENARALITILSAQDESLFWLGVSQPSLAEVWDNPQDDVYGQLVEK
ncbi:MAG TPA: hypothetical protein VGX70_16600 [Gemmataceae bacterium]|jgi:hypothetical protein|nr:hypothetical protein [Gemmataceae bacterium]